MKIINSKGDSITFGRHFRLNDDFELSGLEASVNYSDTTDDGSSYQNTVFDNKEFEIPFFIDRKNNNETWIEEQRARAYTVFNPKLNPFKIEFVTKGNKKYYINSNLESTPSFLRGFENDNRLWLKGLLQFSSNDPYFYQSDSVKVDIATWIGGLQFPLEIPEDGIEMGYRSPSLIANVKNGGQVATGMIMRFRAKANISNPSLINVNTYEKFKLKIDMLTGDYIEVSTYKGRKTITLIRENVSSDIFNTIEPTSVFLQLHPGDNLFRYDVDDGILDYLEVSIMFNNKFLGV